MAKKETGRRPPCIVHQGVAMATADSARDIAAKIDATPIEEMGSQPQDEPHMFCSLLRYFIDWILLPFQKKRGNYHPAITGFMVPWETPTP